MPEDRIQPSPSTWKDPRHFLGLRWKVLFGISLSLGAVIITLTLYGRAILIEQVERDREAVRQRLDAHFSTLIDDRFQQMARLASLVPRLAADSQDSSILAHLRRVLQTDGSMLDLEWDIRSVHWLPLEGAAVSLWPPAVEPLPAPLLEQIRAAPEAITEQLACLSDSCLQVLATPLLWQGETAGTLILGRSLASILLAYQQLTHADLVLATTATNGIARPDQRPSLSVLGATNPAQSRALLASVDADALLSSHPERPLQVQFGDNWFEIFRVRSQHASLAGFIIDQTTAARRAIERMSRNSLLIGLLGLLVGEALLLLIMQGPVMRIRRLSQLLPMLAQDRFQAVSAGLPQSASRIGLRDEIDDAMQIAHQLNQRMAAMHQERQAAQDNLRWLADHDGLTALLNRRRFDQELQRALARAAEAGARGAVLFIDLDNFKDVNDTSGHQAGDRLLKRISRRLIGLICEAGQVGRFGGDEFAVLLHQSTPEDALEVADALQQRIRTTSVRAANHRHRISASIGIALFPDHGIDTQTLMANADLAMYEAKKHHRNRCHLYSEADRTREQANARVLWTHELTEALTHDRLRLYYQPIAPLHGQPQLRAECLLRLERTDGSIVPPNAFIPVAERSGLINAIDRWVVAEAIRVLAAHPGLSLAINLSAKALADQTLDAELEQRLQAAKVDPSRLTLEITETVAIENVQGAIARMQSIQALGCRFALDDFGSGFASYAYLKQLPVNDVKIDGSFVRSIEERAEDCLFVKAITEVSHAMGKQVIAEFVESSSILERLRALGVDFAQGYYIGRPMPEPPDKLP